MLVQYTKLKDILREMFQMDQADLDFGIYCYYFWNLLRF